MKIFDYLKEKIEKLRALPEKKKKRIIIVVLVVAGIILFYLWLKMSLKRLGGL